MAFSTVNIQTAGYAGEAVKAEGYLPAVDVKQAEKIRRHMLKKVKKGGI